MVRDVAYLLLLVALGISIGVWFVKARRREAARRKQEDQLRIERAVRLDAAASAVESQARLGRSVAQRISSSSFEVPASLRDSVNAVVVELDGVAKDLRTCHVTIPERRTLLHR